MSADQSRSISNNPISKDGDEDKRDRGFSDISAENVKLPMAQIDKVRSKSKADLYGDNSPMTSPINLEVEPISDTSNSSSIPDQHV